jgi:hypothetical protein
MTLPRSRAPDAAQRFFSDALQSRGPCLREASNFWVPALRSGVPDDASHRRERRSASGTREFGVTMTGS